MSGRVAKSRRSKQRQRREQLKKMLEKMRGEAILHSFVKIVNSNISNIYHFSSSNKSGLGSSLANNKIHDENKLYMDMSQETIAPLGQEIRGWILKHNVKQAVLGTYYTL